MALKPGDRINFETLQTAFRNRSVALMECRDAKTDEYVAVVCAVEQDGEGMINMVPLARMFSGDPYEEVNPPQTMEDNQGDEFERVTTEMDIDTVFKAIIRTASDSELNLLSCLIYEERKQRTIKRIEENDIPLPTKTEVMEARKSTRTIQPVISYRDRTKQELMVCKEVIEYFRNLSEYDYIKWKDALPE